MRTPAILLLAALAQPALAQMYKCVDAAGVTHYTESPLKGCKGREVQIKPQPPIGTQGARQEDVGEQERAFRRRQVERGEAAQKAAAETKVREQRCQAAKAEQARLSNARIFVRNAKGEREYLDDAATAKRLAQLQENVDKACR